MASAWDEQQALHFILEHHPVLQAQREAHTAEKLLNRLPVLEAMIGERSQAAATLAAAESAAERVQAVAADRTEAAKTALEQATEQDKKNAEREWRRAQSVQAQETANAHAMVEQARIAANYEDYNNRRRSALAELGQLRRRLSEKAARRADEDIQAGEVRQAALSSMAKLRELEAGRAAVETRLGFLQSQSGWLQKQVAQGHPDHALWENAQRRNAETATLQRVDRLIESQRRQIAYLAGDAWASLYRYLSGAAP